MKDRLKFRVFDPITNKMASDFLDFVIDANGNLFFEDHQGSDVKYSPCEKDRRIVDKCTGFKDQNKKLLFWNDIVKDDFGRLYIIESCEGSFHLQRIKLFKEGGYHNDSCYNYTMYAEDRFKIIGNIHQDKDLLEVGEA